jgi:predicted esterase
MHPTVQLPERGFQEPGGKGVPFLFAFMFIPIMLSWLDAFPQQVAKTSPAGTKMWVYTPPSYSTSTSSHPLLVFLHGGGELGDDLTELTTQTSNQYPPKLISINKWDTSLPLIVVSPQLKRDPNRHPNEHTWPASYVNEVVEYIRKTYRIDSYRIYVTGVSIGAAGSWDYAAAYPTKVAALAPISGKADATKACAVKNIPVWVFHGGSDPLVPTKFPIDMVNAIKKCSPAGIFVPRLSLLHARNHEGWNEIYTGKLGMNIYRWMLIFRRGSTSNKKPYVNANSDNKILRRSTYYHIAGDYFDWDGSISSIKWTKVSGPSVTMSGTTSAFLRLSGLQTGLYEFQLAVTDNAGAVSTDRVKLDVVGITSPPAVTGMVLIDGKTNKDIKTITEGMVINKTTLGTTEFNVRANVSSGVYSVKFHVNNDQQTRVVNSPGPYLIKKPTSSPEWVMANGTYVICATPYPQSGARGTPGITLCYRVSVTTSSTTSTSTAGRTPSDETVVIKVLDDVLISNTAEGNQWVLNGEDIAGATGPVYKPTRSGDYFVRIIDRPNYDVSNSVIIQPGQERSRQPFLEVYPNPANDFMTVTGEGIPARTSYSIIRAGGVTVQQGTLEQDNRITFAGHLAKGEYVLIIDAREGRRSAKFVIR